MNTKNYCLSGSVSQRKVECKEKPFSLSYDGRILFNGEVFLTRTHTGFFGTSREVPWPRDIGEVLIEALNGAYKAGYEKDRIEWI